MIMMGPKIFPAFFIASDGNLTLEDLTELLRPVADREMNPASDIRSWQVLSTGTTYLAVPDEALPYGSASGMFPDKDTEEARSVPIDCMGLSHRTYNLLRRAGIATAGDLQDMGARRIRKIRGIGPLCLAEIVSACAEIGVDVR